MPTEEWPPKNSARPRCFSACGFLRHSVQSTSTATAAPTLHSAAWRCFFAFGLLASSVCGRAVPDRRRRFRLGSAGGA
eukprot:8263667-Heterocapsa_arctica.AAC.1